VPRLWSNAARLGCFQFCFACHVRRKHPTPGAASRLSPEAASLRDRRHMGATSRLHRSFFLCFVAFSSYTFKPPPGNTLFPRLGVRHVAWLSQCSLVLPLAPPTRSPATPRGQPLRYPVLFAGPAATMEGSDFPAHSSTLRIPLTRSLPDADPLTQLKKRGQSRRSPVLRAKSVPTCQGLSKTTHFRPHSLYSRLSVCLPYG